MITAMAWRISTVSNMCGTTLFTRRPISTVPHSYVSATHHTRWESGLVMCNSTSAESPSSTLLRRYMYLEMYMYVHPHTSMYYDT
jgi:hypothetical protein